MKFPPNSLFLGAPVDGGQLIEKLPSQPILKGGGFKGVFGQLVTGLKNVAGRAKSSQQNSQTTMAPALVSQHVESDELVMSNKELLVAFPRLEEGMSPLPEVKSEVHSPFAFSSPEKAPEAFPRLMLEDAEPAVTPQRQPRVPRLHRSLEAMDAPWLEPVEVRSGSKRPLVLPEVQNAVIDYSDFGPAGTGAAAVPEPAPQEEARVSLRPDSELPRIKSDAPRKSVGAPMLGLPQPLPSRVGAGRASEIEIAPAVLPRPEVVQSQGLESSGVDVAVSVEDPVAESRFEKSRRLEGSSTEFGAKDSSMEVVRQSASTEIPQGVTRPEVAPAEMSQRIPRPKAASTEIPRIQRPQVATVEIPQGITQREVAPAEVPQVIAQREVAPAEVAQGSTQREVAPAEVPQGSTQREVAPAEVPRGITQREVAPAEVPRGITQREVAPAEVPRGITQREVAPAEVIRGVTQPKVAPTEIPQRIHHSQATSIEIPQGIRQPQAVATEVPQGIRQPQAFATEISQGIHQPRAVATEVPQGIQRPRAATVEISPGEAPVETSELTIKSTRSVAIEPQSDDLPRPQTSPLSQVAKQGTLRNDQGSLADRFPFHSLEQPGPVEFSAPEQHPTPKSKAPDIGFNPFTEEVPTELQVPIVVETPLKKPEPKLQLVRQLQPNLSVEFGASRMEVGSSQMQPIAPELNAESSLASKRQLKTTVAEAGMEFQGDRPPAEAIVAMAGKELRRAFPTLNSSPRPFPEVALEKSTETTPKLVYRMEGVEPQKTMSAGQIKGSFESQLWGYQHQGEAELGFHKTPSPELSKIPNPSIGSLTKHLVLRTPAPLEPNTTLQPVELDQGATVQQSDLAAPTLPVREITTGNNEVIRAIPSRVPEVLAKRAEVIETATQQKIEFHLEPERLGRLKVELSVDPITKQVETHLMVANEAAREALEQQLPNLKARLQDQGMELSTKLSTASENQQGADTQGRGKQGQSHSTGSDWKAGSSETIPGPEEEFGSDGLYA